MNFSFDFLAKVVVTAVLACSGLVAHADDGIPYVLQNSNAFISSSHGFLYVDDDKSYLSSDFSHWQNGAIPQGIVTFNRIASNGKSFIKVDDKKAYSSNDGVTWSLLKGKFPKLDSVFFTNGHFFLVSWHDTKILMSTDGDKWVKSDTDTSFCNKTDKNCVINKIFYFRGQYFAYACITAVSASSATVAPELVIFKSKNGTQWKLESDVLQNDTVDLLTGLYSVAASDEVILGVYLHDNQYTLERSVDGVNWTADNSVAMSNVNYVDGNFYANSVDELVSSDGYNWQTAVWLNGEKVPGGFVTKHKGSLYFIGKSRYVGSTMPEFVTGRSVDSIHWGEVKQN